MHMRIYIPISSQPITMEGETLLTPVVYPCGWSTIVDWIRSLHLRIRVGEMTYSGGQFNFAYYLAKSRSWVICFLFTCSLIVAGLLAYYLGDVPVHRLNSLRNALENSEDSANNAILKEFKLPESLVPLHYDIRLLPILEPKNLTTFGRVSIDIECLEDTDRIVLHSLDTIVDSKTIKVVEKLRKILIAIQKFEYDTDKEFLIIYLKSDSKLIKGRNYTLSMSFTSKLHEDSSIGFYRFTYIEQGASKYMASTQFEPTDARRVFPCFDEPDLKATFRITLGRHRDMKALSNMPLINTSIIEGRNDYLWDEFAPTVPMQTYLVAMVVGDVAQTKIMGDYKWDFNIYSRPTAINQAQYARRIAPEIQSFYEEYFKIPFPLPKQDLIAVPSFEVVAMENWGLITFQENCLLVDEKLSSATDKLTVLGWIAHELAHQWFGNLVTMEWWNDLWLNEGFATFVQYIGGSQVEPSFQLSQLVVTNEVQTAMQLDVLETSKPMSHFVHRPDEFNENFDDIPYHKGSSIIRMLSNFIGEETFKDGIKNYLKSNKFGNAVQDDLWNALDQQVKIDRNLLPTSVKQIMDSWTLQMGYPVVTVRRDYRNTRNITLSQERFILRPSNNKEQNTENLWWIYLNYTNDFNNFGSLWLSDNKADEAFSFDIGKNQWVIFNVDEMGYFRVNYDKENWRLIQQQLMNNHSAIPPINRAQIIDDSMNLARSGLLDYATALNLTLYLVKERDYLPWASAFSAFGYVASMMSTSSSNDLLVAHLKAIITPIYTSLGFHPIENEDFLTVLLRMKVTSAACNIIGDRDCIDNAVQLYSQWMFDPENQNIISPHLKEVIVCTAIREGGKKEWDFALDRYKNSNFASERSVLVSALACTNQPWLLNRLLEWSLSPSSEIKKQDKATLISNVAKNPVGCNLVYNFIRSHWSELKELLVSAGSLGSIVQSTTESFSTIPALESVLKFKEEHQMNLGRANRTTEQSIDRILNNIHWRKNRKEMVTEWLRSTYAKK